MWCCDSDKAVLKVRASGAFHPESTVDSEYAHIIYLVDAISGEYELLKLTSIELFATKLACSKTSMIFSEIVKTPRFSMFIKAVSQK